MTSESEAFKTNEFLRRRKLRIQQVREQSKEIAKKIRQRAKVEKLKEVGELDATKQKEYFHHQDKLVKQLEQLYAAGVRNVGTSHKHASEVNVQDIPENLDVSKKRGKEAVTELRRKKQEKLDQQKRLLDRKLQAREAANEISRDKSSIVASKLLKDSSGKTEAGTTNNENTQQNAENQTVNIVSKEESKNKEDSGNKAERVDMATQWNYEELPEEWEPHIPELLIPRNDEQNPKETTKHNEVRPDQSKPLNLFGLSDEMPPSLRGGHTDDSTISAPKTTLNLVSEYLQNRNLHLREYDYTSSKKKHDIDLQSIRNTILRARAANDEGIFQQNVCHVADVQVVPVPSWYAENRYGHCPQHTECHRHTVSSRHYKTIPNYDINHIFSSIRPKIYDMPSPSPVLRGVSPFKRSKFDQEAFAGRSTQKSTKSNETEVSLQKKKSVTMYDHSTRDTKDIPCGGKKLVVRDNRAEEDAYSQAARESASVANEDKHQKKLQEMRNKIAVTKQNVEKEYRDTMAFLKSMPKEKSKPVKYAFMDEERQENHKELRQKKMHGEFKKIEKECRKQALIKMNNNPTSKLQTKSKSPDKFDSDDDFAANDFQYSWMPVPETDRNLAIHTIPTQVKERKSKNGVHFSKVDSYHEYRSRHKHTPPTKDTIGPKKQSETKARKALVIEDNAENSDNSSTLENDDVFSSDTLTPREAPNSNGDDAGKLSDAERIIIYKILETKVSKRDKEKKSKVMMKIAKSLNSTGKNYLEDEPLPSSSKGAINDKVPCKHRASKSPVFERLNEEIYKTVNEKRENITSMYYSENAPDAAQAEGSAAVGDDASKQATAARGHKINWESSDVPSTEIRNKFDCCCKDASTSIDSRKKSEVMPSAATSTSSFRTASNAVTQAQPLDEQVNGGYIKLLDQDGQEAGKFYIGASGFIKSDAYEVIIQLKKKDEKNEMVNTEKTSSETSLLEKQKNDPRQLMKNNEGPNNRQESESLISEQNAVTVDQNKSFYETELNKQHEEDKDKAIAKKNSEEIGLLSSDGQAESVATDNNNKELDTQEEPSMSKGQNVPKQSTTCTQTSFENNDERHRPMRMSSTSTAYMSPPEFILPNFLKQDRKMPLGELQDFTVNSNLEGIEFINQESLCCGDFEYCRCKRCIYEKEIVQCRKSPYEKHVLKAPPNTVRSGAGKREQEVTRFANDEKRHHNHKSKHIHSCRKRSGTKAPFVYFSKHNRSISLTKKTSQNFMQSVHLKPITKKKNLNDSNMDPVIKSYVNKLLNLNKKALQAIEVANQDCSSVTTPGSSVIEVPLNKNCKSVVEPKISLEQIKEILAKDIINANEIQSNKFHITSKDNRRKCFSSYGLKKRSMRKVKPLKKISKPKPNNEGTSDKEVELNKPFKDRSKSSSQLLDRKSMIKLPANASNLCSSSSKSDEYIVPSVKDSLKCYKENTNSEAPSKVPPSAGNRQSSDYNSTHYYEPASKETASGSESNGVFKNLQLSPSKSKQTYLAENNLMKLAEDKLQNMEKIAELTEKCTKRLSSLAKVLEEVRKNKTAYSQISDSDSDKMSDRMVPINKQTVSSCDKILESKIKSKNTRATDTCTESIQPEPTNVINKDVTSETDDVTSEYVPLLSNIPKPSRKMLSSNEIYENGSSPILFSSKNMNEDLPNVKVKAKPPPALARINLIQGLDLEHVIPHELSTVAEVDSPLSAKFISQSKENKQSVSATREQQHNPDLLQSNANLKTSHTKMSNDSSDESKIQMMDLKQFNEIMLTPFISVQDYLKQCNAPSSVEDRSKIEQHPKESPLSDDISSLHSDGSLPDVIAELLKRNVIKEPFKFETASNNNVNSTTVSSESTFSMLALSKAKMEKKSRSLNKENIAETSDSMSISSNPDLEHAFKQLGMGWASSTLKKTKERLALSSSSNTSSSSTEMRFKIKPNNIDVPYIVSDTVSSMLDFSKKAAKDPSKNAEQQTSQIDSMTVKEFLTNQLAKKITFTNKSRRDGTEEFISLCETQMPEHMHQSSQIIHEMSGTSVGNRARTSTPVQIFKSMAYQTSSSSNTSNGLFSNADELSSVKGTSNSLQNHSTSDKDDLTIPNFNLKLRKGLSDASKSD